MEKLPTTNSVLSYGTKVGSATPYKLADHDQVKQLINGGYIRIVLSSSITDEAPASFQLVETVRNLCHEYYGDDYYCVGNTVSYYDIRAVTGPDMTHVKLISIIAISLVLLLMFRSISIPILLISAIEVSIWINESFPYFMGTTTNFVAFLVIDAVQLGAAVDYAIIFTEEYRARRMLMDRRKAALVSIENSAQPIITSSSILIFACLGIYFFTSTPMMQQVGMLIARGAFISVVEIFFCLPLLFRLCDGFVRRTTYKARFFDDWSDRTRVGRGQKAPVSNVAAANCLSDEGARRDMDAVPARAAGHSCDRYAPGAAGRGRSSVTERSSGTSASSAGHFRGDASSDAGTGGASSTTGAKSAKANAGENERGADYGDEA